MADGSYAVRLKVAMSTRPGSRRKLSFELADETGNKQASEYRALGKYLSGDELPSPDRAGLLARLTGDPNLAVVPTNGDRRRGRQAELEERVDELEELVGRLSTQIREMDDRVGVLERPARPRRAPAKKKAAG